MSRFLSLVIEVREDETAEALRQHLVHAQLSQGGWAVDTGRFGFTGVRVHKAEAVES